MVQETKSSTPLALPKVPWKDIFDPSPEVISKLTKICEELGFFILTDHPVPLDLVHRVQDAALNFFNLPEEVKNKYDHSHQVVEPKECRSFSGEEKLGYDSQKPPDIKQKFDLGLERPLVEGKTFRGPTIMPDDETAPDFKRSLFDMQNIVMEQMVMPISRALALALGQDKHFFDEAMTEPSLIHRVVYYPAKRGMAGKHTDSCLFTLLFQEEGSKNGGDGSLRVLPSGGDGEWIGVEAREKDVVVNLGDTIQYWSNNRFISTPHCVEHNGQCKRISQPYFFYTNLATEFVPIGESEDKKRTAKDVAHFNFYQTWTQRHGSGRAADFI